MRNKVSDDRYVQIQAQITLWKLKKKILRKKYHAFYLTYSHQIWSPSLSWFPSTESYPTTNWELLSCTYVMF